MFQVYALLILCFLSVSGREGWCEQTPVLKKLARLNPKFSDKVQGLSATSLYLAIKREEEHPSFDHALKEHLVSEFGKMHQLAKLSNSGLKQFYLNALYNVYRRLAVEVLIEQYTKWAQHVPHPELRDFAASLAGLFLRPRNLMDRYLSAASAQESLTQTPPPAFDWQTVEMLAQRWLSKSQGKEFTQREISSWLDRQADALTMPYLDRERVVMALSGWGLTPRPCCVSTPGCFNCPNNRGTLCVSILTSQK